MKRSKLARAIWWQQVLLLLLHNSLSWQASANDEGDALLKLKSSLLDPKNILQSWDQSLAGPCIWFHVTCNNNGSVIRVDLGNSGLAGTLVPDIGQLPNLQYLELYGNNLSGHIPPELGNLENLYSLDLYQNNIIGEIPVSLGKLTNLHALRLNNNNLKGSVPATIGNLQSLQVLDLSNNGLEGRVPFNGSFKLFTPLSFQNNTRLCGPIVGKICPGDPPESPPPFVAPAPEKRKSSNVKVIAGGVAASVALVCAVSVIGFFTMVSI